MGQGEVGGCTTLPDSAWWQLQLPLEKPWSMTGGPFVCFLAFSGWRALTIERLLMSGCVQGRELTDNVSIKP